MSQPTYWIAAQTLLDRAAARVGRSLEASGSANVRAVAENSIRMAHGVIVTILANKGWTLADLDGWDYRADYLTRMALFFFFTDLSIDGFDQSRLAPYDVRPELGGSNFTLIVGGVAKSPSAGDTGPDGLDFDGLPGADVVGNNNVAVGRLSEKHWTTRRDTRF